MLKGYYELTSSMLTQSRNQNVISNNMTNVSTPGFKKDTLVLGSFQDELFTRMANNDSNPLNRTTFTAITNYNQGAFDETGGTFDFAVNGKGFFQVQTPNGPVYTRNGSFTLDDQGYLSLQHVGRVMGENGPILIDSDKIAVDATGNIYKEGNVNVGKLLITEFTDEAQLAKTGEGMFQNANAGNAVNVPNPSLEWKKLEGSNVDAMEEMVNMMSSQRALQSASQMVKMYDQLLSKASTEIGRA